MVIEFNNKIIIQWGCNSITDNVQSDAITVTLPTTYSSRKYAVVCNDNGAAVLDTGATPISPSQFNYWISRGYSVVLWISLGY